MKRIKTNIKRILSSAVATCMLCTGFVGVNATEITDETVNTDNEVVYQLQDLNANDGSTIDTTQADIEEGHWNVDALGDVSPEIYKNFPMQVNSDYDNMARLNMSFTYFKVVDDGDSADFIMTDRSSGEVYYSQELTTDSNTIYLEDVPINHVYNLTITENFDGETADYGAVIETIYDTANMPGNVYIGESANINNTIMAESVNVAKAVDNDRFISDENGNITIISEVDENNIISISVDKLQSYYDNINDNDIYCIQTDATSELLTEHYIGFFSKSPELSGMGIFVPKHKFYYADEYSEISTIANPIIPLTGKEVYDEAGEYEYLQDGTFAFTRFSDYIVIKHVFPQYGSFVIETVGNPTIDCDVWTANSPTSTPTYSYSLLGYPNISEETTVTAGVVLYWVIQFNDVMEGNSIFRIRSTDFPSDRSNSIYDLEQNNNRTISDRIYNEYIEYAGDVDIYYANTASENGEYSFNMTNNSSSIMKMIVQYRTTPTSVLWQLATRTVNPGRTVINSVRTSNTSYHYFATVRADGSTIRNLNYSMEIMSPYRGDPYEPNNTWQTATDLVNIKGYSGKITDLTIHKNDIDYLKFTTGSSMHTVDLWLHEADGMQYNMYLYKLNSGGNLELISSEKDFDTGDYIYLTNISPNTTYYIRIDNVGLGANTYSAAVGAIFDWSIF